MRVCDLKTVKSGVQSMKKALAYLTPFCFGWTSVPFPPLHLKYESHLTVPAVEPFAAMIVIAHPEQLEYGICFSVWSLGTCR